jgi:hypothetical protein
MKDKIKVMLLKGKTKEEIIAEITREDLQCRYDELIKLIKENQQYLEKVKQDKNKMSIEYYEGQLESIGIQMNILKKELGIKE